MQYTEVKPSGDWILWDYNTSHWKSGMAAIGDDEKHVKTLWKTDDIWVRRTFNITDPSSINDLYLKINHDDNIEVFLNGKRYMKKTDGPIVFNISQLEKLI